MQVFVTGGSGFVGGQLIEALRARGATVCALARSELAARQVEALGARPLTGDLTDEAALRVGMQGCQVVFHAAARVDDWGRYDDFYRVNVEGTERALRAAQAEKVPRFVHVSTEAVLVGGPPLVRVDESRPRPERALGLYPRTKALAEERVLAARAPEFCTVIVRPRLVWGKGDRSLLPKLVEAIRSRRFLWIDGGHYLTSTCHVRNVADGLILAAERGLSGEIYFLSDGEPVEMRRFLTALLATQGLTPGDRSLPRWLAIALARVSQTVWSTLRLSGAPPLTETAVRLIGEEVTVDDTKARRELGYREVVSREEGLRAMCP